MVGKEIKQLFHCEARGKRRKKSIVSSLPPKSTFILSTINYKRNRALPLKSVICRPVATGFSYQWVWNVALQHNPIEWKIYLLTRFRWFIHSLMLEKHWNQGDGSVREVVRERGSGWWCWFRPEAYQLGCQFVAHWFVYKGQTQQTRNLDFSRTFFPDNFSMPYTCGCLSPSQHLLKQAMMLTR